MDSVPEVKPTPPPALALGEHRTLELALLGAVGGQGARNQPGVCCHLVGGSVLSKRVGQELNPLLLSNPLGSYTGHPRFPRDPPHPS